MFLSAGDIVESIEASKKNFGRVLVEYISKGFSGRISYKGVMGTYVSLEIVNGTIALCRGVVRGNVVEGNKCCDEAANYLYVAEGVVEVMKIDPKIIGLDAINFPNSVVEGTTVMHGQLSILLAQATPTAVETPKIAEAKAVKAVETPKPEIPAVAQAPPTPPTPPTPLTPPTPPAPPTTRSIQPIVSEECIDPILLYQIMKSSQILQQISSAKYVDISEKIIDIARERKPSKIYITASTESGTLRILLDVESMNINIEYEEGGKTICGSNALKSIEAVELKSIRIWTL